MTFSKIFLTLKFWLCIFFFPNSTHKTKIGIANRWGETTILIANHLDESFGLANQKQGTVVRSYLLHSFLGRYLGFAVPFTTILSKPYIKSCAKIILLNQRGMNDFNFSSSNFNLQEGHILKHWRSEGITLYNAQREHSLYQ